MLVEAIRVVIKVLMETHAYEFANIIRRQTKGGAIGMELTGVFAQIFMVWWDKEYTKKLNDVQIQLKLHFTWTTQTLLEHKRRWERDMRKEESRKNQGTRMKECQMTIRTMKLLQSTANTIHQSIKMTIDYPSKNTNVKVPMLDIGEVDRRSGGKKTSSLRTL